MASQLRDQEALSQDVARKRPALDKALESGTRLLESLESAKSGEDDQAYVHDKMDGLQKRYKSLGEKADERLEGIRAASPVAHGFNDSCRKLLEWLQEVAPAVQQRGDNPKEVQVSTMLVVYVLFSFCRDPFANTSFGNVFPRASDPHR